MGQHAKEKGKRTKGIEMKENRTVVAKNRNAIKA